MSRILNEIEAALAAATPGPWKCDKGTIFNDECPVVTIGELNMEYETGEFRRSTPNSRLVIALVNSAAALLRVCRAAHDRMRHGHHEKCAGQLGQTNTCICGFDGLGESLEAVDYGEWRDNP